MPTYLWPMTPPPPILVGYRLVKFGPCACLTSACVQNLPAAFAVVWRLICTFCPPSLNSYGVSYFLIPHSLWPTPFRGRALLGCGFFFLQPTLLLISTVLLPFLVIPFCHSCCDVILPQSVGPFRACHLFFFQWLNIVIWALYYIACGLFCPIYFLLGVLGPLAFLGLPSPFF